MRRGRSGCRDRGLIDCHCPHTESPSRLRTGSDCCVNRCWRARESRLGAGGAGKRRDAEATLRAVVLQMSQESPLDGAVGAPVGKGRLQDVIRGVITDAQQLLVALCWHGRPWVRLPLVPCSPPCVSVGVGHVGWPFTLLAARTSCSGSPGSCRPAVLFLGKTPGLRPGLPGPLWLHVHSASGQHLSSLLPCSLKRPSCQHREPC